jgi:hypothetical protein
VPAKTRYSTAPYCLLCTKLSIEAYHSIDANDIRARMTRPIGIRVNPLRLEPADLGNEHLGDALIRA